VPNSWVRLDFRAHDVHAEAMFPETELAFALGAPSAASLSAYLLKHIGAVRETTYFDHCYFVADLTFGPPPGSSSREFVLTHDASTHEVRNHVVIAVASRDYSAPALAATPDLLGALQYPARQLAIRRPTDATR
jgi:hypothetical protein